MQKLRNLLAFLMLFVPEQMPQSDLALESFIQGVCKGGGYPINDSFRHAVAASMLHIDSSKIYVTKYSFIKMLKRAEAAQAAYNLIQQVKANDKEAAASKVE